MLTTCVCIQHPAVHGAGACTAADERRFGALWHHQEVHGPHGGVSLGVGWRCGAGVCKQRACKQRACDPHCNAGVVVSRRSSWMCWGWASRAWCATSYWTRAYTHRCGTGEQATSSPLLRGWLWRTTHEAAAAHTEAAHIEAAQPAADFSNGCVLPVRNELLRRPCGVLSIRICRGSLEIGLEKACGQIIDIVRGDLQTFA